MASVTVFVDDAVRGTLPAVCARDGVATSDSLRQRRPVGDRAGLGIAWLLLLAGPLGWVALVIISLSRSGRAEELQVTLPMAEVAYQRMRAARRLRDRAALTLFVSMAAALLLYGASGPGALTSFGLLVASVVAVGALVMVIVEAIRFDRESVGVSLDASRRWVTLSNVHPHFVAACEAHEAARADRA